MFIPRKSTADLPAIVLPGRRLLFRERGAKHPEGRTNQKSTGLTPHPLALSLLEDPLHKVLKSELGERPERRTAEP